MRGNRDVLDPTRRERLVTSASQLTRRGPKGDLGSFLAAVVWILRTGAPWRDLAERFGRWDRIYRRYRRWAIAGQWDSLHRALSPAEHEELLLIDSTIVKAHAHAAGALRRTGGQEREALGRSRGGFTTKLHALVTERGRLVRYVLTGGERNDITQAPSLVRAREGNARRRPRHLDRRRYARRNVIERWFGRMKAFRRIATRYEKTSSSYAGFVTAATIVALCGWPG